MIDLSASLVHVQANAYKKETLIREMVTLADDFNLSQLRNPLFHRSGYHWAGRPRRQMR